MRKFLIEIIQECSIERLKNMSLMGYWLLSLALVFIYIVAAIIFFIPIFFMKMLDGIGDWIKHLFVGLF